MNIYYNVDSKSIEEFVEHEKELGSLFFPLLLAIIFKDNVEIEDHDSLEHLKLYNYDITEFENLKLVRNYCKGEVLWQPYYASMKDKWKHYVDDVFPKEKTYTLFCNKEFFYAPSEVRDYVGEAGSLISVLIRSQTLLRRFMKGEVGENEILLFLYAILGYCDCHEIETKEMVEALNLFFTCIDLDYKEPVPVNYEETNVEILTRIFVDKRMDLAERMRKMEIDNDVPEKHHEFIASTSFVGGFDFFYRMKPRAADFFFDELSRKTNYRYKLPKANKPCIVNMKNLSDKRIFSLTKNLFACTDVYRPFDMLRFNTKGFHYESDMCVIRVDTQ